MMVHLRSATNELVHKFVHAEDYVDGNACFIYDGVAYTFLYHAYIDGQRAAIYKARRTIQVFGGPNVE